MFGSLKSFIFIAQFVCTFLLFGKQFGFATCVFCTYVIFSFDQYQCMISLDNNPPFGLVIHVCSRKFSTEISAWNCFCRTRFGGRSYIHSPTLPRGGSFLKLVFASHLAPARLFHVIALFGEIRPKLVRSCRRDQPTTQTHQQR